MDSTPCSRCGRDAADPVHGGRHGHAYDVALLDERTDVEPLTTVDAALSARLQAAGFTPQRAQEVVDARNQLQRELDTIAERDHADALAEDAAHDAAVAAAEPVQQYLARVTGPRLPRAMRYGAGRRLVMPQ